MNRKAVVLYVSLALNVALLVLLVLPRSSDNVALGQVASVVGTYAAVSAKSGGTQEALWLANRTSGQMVIYEYQIGSKDNPVQAVATRDLRADLDERQIGNLMLVNAAISDTTAAVYVVDTDSERMVAYRYNRSDHTVEMLQQILLRGNTGTASSGGSSEY